MRTQTNHFYGWAAAVLLVLGGAGQVRADEYYAGGVTVDIDEVILGYIWVEDATVNLYENAHIANDAFFGDIYATSGSVVNLYGGAVDGVIYITTASNGLPDAQVTVYGRAFAVDGAAVDPGVSELLLVNQTLSGEYDSGTAFSHVVDGSSSGITIKLAWLVEAPDPAEQMAMILAYYELAVDDGSITPVYRGWGWWSQFKRHDPFEKMLRIPQRLIDLGYDDYAARVLWMIEKKCDGNRRPSDLITGDGVATLNAMINELIATLTETE